MTKTLISFVVVMLIVPSSAFAGELLDSMTRIAANVELEQAEPQAEPRQGRSTTKKVVGWSMLVAGALTVLGTREQCDGLEIGDSCIGETSWPAGQIAGGTVVAGVGALLLTVF